MAARLWTTACCSSRALKEARVAGPSSPRCTREHSGCHSQWPHSDGSPENRRLQKAVEDPDLLESLWEILRTKQPYRVNFSDKTCLLHQVHRWPHGEEWGAAPSIVREPGQGRNNLYQKASVLRNFCGKYETVISRFVRVCNKKVWLIFCTSF